MAIGRPRKEKKNYYRGSTYSYIIVTISPRKNKMIGDVNARTVMLPIANLLLQKLKYTKNCLLRKFYEQVEIPLKFS